MIIRSKEQLSLKEESAALGIPFISNVTDDLFSKELVKDIPISWARSQPLLPILYEGVPSLLISRPDDLESLNKVAIVLGRELEPVVTENDILLNAIERCYGLYGSASSLQKEEPLPVNVISSEEETTSSPICDLLSSEETSPCARFLNSVLLQAVRENASDIHFEPFSDKFVIRFRIDGILYERFRPSAEMIPSLISRLKVISGMDISEKRLPQDGMAKVRLGEKKIDIRTSTIPVADGERIVLRLLDREDAHHPLEDLGFFGKSLSDFRNLLKQPNGIIIVSGPTGSGKTTTLYSALGELDALSSNIITIEDPVEYRLDGISQIQVKPKIGLTFASGLRHILRQDPDVVLVGETRDPETAEIAVRASLTGHLVFTTLHTNDAPSAIMRLTDMGVPPYLLASSLRGVLAQRLVRKLCPKCKRQAASGLVHSQIGHLPQNWITRFDENGMMEATGCAECLGGYKGRMAIFEMMTINEELSSLIRSGVEDGRDLREAALRGGMVAMADDGLEKVAMGLTDLREISGALAL